jgi:L-lactate dehydrogenase complex protein LldE
VKEHFPKLPDLEKEHREIHDKIFELTEFLTDVLQVRELKGSFPYKVGYHASCHGQRGLRLASSSEMNSTPFNKAKSLLENLEGLEWMTLNRTDECCGFGGTFSVTEEALSIRMGKDRLDDHEKHQVEILTGGDMSCIMHLQGIASREGRNVKFMHLAEILNQAIQ